MPLKSGYSQGTMDANRRELKGHRHPTTRELLTPEQINAIVLEKARESFFKRYPEGFLPSYLKIPGGRRDRASWEAWRKQSRKPNPCSCAPNPIKDRRTRINQGIKLFSDFTGEQGEVVGTYPRPKPLDVGVVIGELAGVAYETVRDGKHEAYYHEFSTGEGIRPLLVASSDGKQIVILGGEYDFTENGIVDADDAEYSPRLK